MTDRGALPPKLYFRIGEVAGLVGVEPHVLRYWEREFRSIRPSKSAKGQRVYSRRDVENLLRVRELLYGQGFTIAGARKRLRDKDAAHDESPDGPDVTGLAPESAPAPEVTTDAAQDVATHAMTAAAGAARANGAEEAEQRTSSLHVRREIESLKAEVEAFLAELAGAP
jgi:DNA-binding transcriptional MerR regulator